MTKGDASMVLILLTQLYPQWTATEPMLEVIGDMFAIPFLDVDEGKAIVRDHATKHAWPNIPALSATIKAAANRRMIEHTTAIAKASNTNHDPSRKSITEWRDWYRDTPDGREEWKRLPANIRRGLRSMWKDVTA